MNVKLYHEALGELEQLHGHLHRNEGPDLWTAQLPRMFTNAMKDEPAEDERMYLGAEPSQMEPPTPTA